MQLWRQIQERANRKGPVDDRTQLDLDPKKGKFVKRDTTTGRFMDLKKDEKPFKGVRKEKDEGKRVGE